jgi:hypothetical protein
MAAANERENTVYGREDARLDQCRSLIKALPIMLQIYRIPLKKLIPSAAQSTVHAVLLTFANMKIQPLVP